MRLTSDSSDTPGTRVDDVLTAAACMWHALTPCLNVSIFYVDVRAAGGDFSSRILANLFKEISVHF